MPIANYVNAKKQLLNMFGVKEDFFIKPCIDKKWQIVIENDLPLLKFGNAEEDYQVCVIVKKDNKLMVFKKKKHTLVVALDCVKICFIFDNSKYNGIMEF